MAGPFDMSQYLCASSQYGSYERVGTAVLDLVKEAAIPSGYRDGEWSFANRRFHSCWYILQYDPINNGMITATYMYDTVRTAGVRQNPNNPCSQNANRNINLATALLALASKKRASEVMFIKQQRAARVVWQ
jgi:hypothetical protein